MIEKRPMTVDDYLEIMAKNAHIYTEFAQLTDEKKRDIATLYATSGTAQSYRLDGQLVGVGGLFMIGIAEAWFITPPDIREHKAKSMYREVKKVLTEAKEHGVHRIYAETRISKNFLEHLKFKQQTMFVRTT